jgi:uncharacterized Fe-S center protein
MKRLIITCMAGLAALTMTAQTDTESSVAEKSKVFVTRDISAESLVNIYNALGRKAEGRVAVKISTGESEKTGYLRPALIKDLVQEVNGTIVECNTAYGGARQSTEDHWNAIRERGFMDIAKVDIMDEEGDMRIPVRDTTWLKYDIVGTHMQNYDFMINLAHFKGHQMGGLGGVLKNASIGCGSTAGKAYIHSHGVTDKTPECWQYTQPQDAFIESMAAAAQAVHEYFNGGKNILYISVMYKMSIDCDCNGDPQPPLFADYGILASLDPVALDQACFDIVTQIHNDEHNNTQPLLNRIEKLHGTHIMEWGEKIGLGTRQYELVSIDKK